MMFAGRQPVQVDVLVVGSIHMDEVFSLHHAPAAGETVLAHNTTTSAGGKGANQAVAAARWGAQVAMIGCVGDDATGEQLLSLLTADGIDTQWVAQHSEPSGRAIILLDANGENRIVVAPGASGTLSGGYVAAAAGDLRCAAVVAQCEVPEDAIVAAAELANATDARFVLNLAPYRPTSPDVLKLADPLVLNETELRGLLGDSLTGEVTSERTAAALAGLVQSAVITLGAAGAIVLERRGSAKLIPAPIVTDVVDTTGAGDTLVGVVAACLARGSSLQLATETAVRAAAQSVTRAGAQSSIPYRSGEGEKP
jgi:ribokinase